MDTISVQNTNKKLKNKLTNKYYRI